MKTMKKLLSLVLAVMMVSAMAVAAFAADERSLPITIKNSLTNRKYYAYQVFAGTINDKGVMANIQWGDCVDATRENNGDPDIPDIYEELMANPAFIKDGSHQFNGVDTAEKVANVMAKWSYNESYVKAFADVVNNYLTEANKVGSEIQNNDIYTINVTKPGYYIIKEVAIADGLSGAQAYTDYLLNISGATNIEPKTSEPTITHKVNYMPDATYEDATDLQVGALAYYKADIKMPNLIKDYKQFHLHAYIDLPEGLTMSQSEETNNVYIQHAAGARTALDRDDYDVTFNLDGSGATVDFGDLISLYGSKLSGDDIIVIKYAATVNSKAIMVTGTNDTAKLGNVATMKITFSNDMNEPAPIAPEDIHSVKTGEASASTSVYTYQVEFKKIDSLTNEPLAGAEFILFRDITENYIEIENEVPVQKERVVRYYAVANTAEVDGIQEATITEWSTDLASATEFVSSASANAGSKGKFIIKGLDALTYELKETQAPSGYNDMLETVKVAITSSITGRELKALKCVADSGTYDTATDPDSTAAANNLNEGKVLATIRNTPGSTLPATGGIGTTIFYIVGAVLLIGSSVIFIMKKRNEA